MRNIRKRSWLTAIGAALIGSALLAGVRQASAAAPVLALSNTTVQNATGQQIIVTINGTDTNIEGADLFAQINDGGTANGGTSTKPTITTINMTTAGMMFAGNVNAFQQNTGPLIGYDGPSSGTPLSDAGPLTFAAITVDASAMSPGNTFTIQFANVAGTHNSDVQDSLANKIFLTGTGVSSPATITVVPEPMSASLMLLGIGGLALRRSRR